MKCFQDSLFDVGCDDDEEERDEAIGCDDDILDESYENVLNGDGGDLKAEAREPVIQ